MFRENCISGCLCCLNTQLFHKSKYRNDIVPTFGGKRQMYKYLYKMHMRTENQIYSVPTFGGK